MSKRASVKTVYDWLNEIAPFETAESYDNVGLLIGSMHAPVERILVALDATPAVVQEALDLDVQLIVTHHPLMFGGVKRLLYDAYEGGLITSIIQNGLHLIAAHTNLDQSSELSGTACLARKLGLQNLRQEGFVFVGDLPEGEMPAGLLREKSPLQRMTLYICSAMRMRKSKRSESAAVRTTEALNRHALWVPRLI